MTFEEKAVSVVYLLTAVLWMTRSPIELSNIRIPGWSQLFQNPKFLSDGTVGMTMAFLLFLTPSRKRKRQKADALGRCAKTPVGNHYSVRRRLCPCLPALKNRGFRNRWEYCLTILKTALLWLLSLSLQNHGFSLPS